MSCSIPKNTVGYITIPTEKWEKFNVVIKDMMPQYLPGNSILIEGPGDLESLVPEFIDSADYADLVNYCDDAEFGES